MQLSVPFYCFMAVFLIYWQILDFVFFKNFKKLFVSTQLNASKLIIIPVLSIKLLNITLTLHSLIHLKMNHCAFFARKCTIPYQSMSSLSFFTVNAILIKSVAVNILCKKIKYFLRLNELRWLKESDMRSWYQRKIFDFRNSKSWINFSRHNVFNVYLYLF